MRDERVRASSLRLGAACLLGLSTVLVSCYPGEITSVDELDLVVTKYVTEYDFQQNRTYVLPDTVIHILDLDDGEGDDVLTRVHDRLILDTVRANMDSLGYQEVELDTTCVGDCSQQDSLDCGGEIRDCPDIVVLVSALGVENYQAWISGPWYGGWGWYPGWGYWPGYGPGWGAGWPPTVGVSSFAIGSVFVDIWDPQDELASASDTLGVLPAVWVGALNGPLEGSQSDQPNRLVNGLDQMFTQSPYLKLD